MKPKKQVNKRIPGSTARALSDLVAEGGNVLASDDAAASGQGSQPVDERRPQSADERPSKPRAPKP